MTHLHWVQNVKLLGESGFALREGRGELEDGLRSELCTLEMYCSFHLQINNPLSLKHLWFFYSIKKNVSKIQKMFTKLNLKNRLLFSQQDQLQYIFINVNRSPHLFMKSESFNSAIPIMEVLIWSFQCEMVPCTIFFNLGKFFISIFYSS